MKIVANRRNIKIPSIIFIFGVLYAGWLILGLRYVASDDAMLSLVEKSSKHHYFQFASALAEGLGRIIFYPKIMIAMWIYSIYESIWYDILNEVMFIVLWITIMWFISYIVGTVESIFIIGFCLFMFPLHFYYTIPQGYGPTEYYGMITLFASLGLLAGHIRTPSFVSSIVSVVLFGVALSGSEFIFVLGPALIVLTILFFHKNMGRSATLFAPYLVVLVVSASAYLIFSIYHPGSDHTLPRFNVRAFAETFFGLEQKSFVPIGLIQGIMMLTPVAQGLPGVPPLVDYQSLFATSPDYASLAGVFVVGVAAFGWGLHVQQISRRNMIFCILVAAVIIIAPIGLVSLSAVYQSLVPQHITQGHIASFLSQLGGAIFVWLLLASIVNCGSGNVRRALVILSATGLSFLTMTVFTYDNINRQSMNANMQRWSAFTILANYINYDREDLRAKDLYIPEFNQQYEVSAAPGALPPYYTNYWEDFSLHTFGYSTKALAPRLPDIEGSVYATYFAVPSGKPLVAIIEPPHNNLEGRVTLISKKPLSGRLLHGVQTFDLVGWSCNSICVLQLSEDRPIEIGSLVLEADDKGVSSLFGQFFVSRNGAFGRLATAYPNLGQPR